MNRIFSMLKKQKKHISFHTPGHKVGKWDITELSFSDNLSCPNGVLKEAEDDITKILGAKKSFILTDGSTSGVLSMLYASKVKRLFLPKSSHKSAYNGCKLMGIEPIVWDKNEGALPPIPTVNDLEPVKEQIDGVFLTSPDYYGRVPDLKAISVFCKAHSLKLLIDGAHGGHLKGTDLYAGKYADYWVDGVHKSMAALTQGAIVSTNTDETALKEAVDIFRTTSPNYMIMASVEYAVKKEANERVRAEARKLISEFGIPNDDWTKLVVPFGQAAFEVEEWLEKRNIYPEFCDGQYIMFYFSDSTKLRELKILKRTLKKLKTAQNETTITHQMGERTDKVVLVDLGEAVGKTVAKTLGLFPPCIPLVGEGEIFTEADAKRLKQAKNTFGTEGKRIYVYDR